MLAATFACLSINKAQAVDNSELIRASIIEKVASFIEWPTLDQAQFKLCAFENTPLLAALETYYANSLFNEKPVKVVTFRDFTVSNDCQILYLSAEESLKLEEILKQIGNRPTLVITEKKDAVSRGAHVDFFVEDNRLRLEINRLALSRNRFKASYHLLGVARIVE
ncbi:MAG: YfiR family protein [Gammaproteobacteria bacterium]